jgi:hypothetical protein
MLSEFLLVIFVAPSCFPLRVKTVSLLEAFQLLTLHSKVSKSLGNPLHPQNRFCTNLWLSWINWSVFPVYGAFVPVLHLYCSFFYCCYICCLCSVCFVFGFRFWVLCSFCVVFVFLWWLYTLLLCCWDSTLIYTKFNCISRTTTTTTSSSSSSSSIVFKLNIWIMAPCSLVICYQRM